MVRIAQASRAPPRTARGIAVFVAQRLAERGAVQNYADVAEVSNALLVLREADERLNSRAVLRVLENVLDRLAPTS